MKKWVIAALTVGLLAGCSSTLSEDEYVDLVHETPGLAPYSAEDLHSIGGSICDAFKADTGYPRILATLIEKDISAGDAGVLIALSVNQYCADQLDKVPTASS